MSLENKAGEGARCQCTSPATNKTYSPIRGAASWEAEFIPYGRNICCELGPSFPIARALSRIQRPGILMNTWACSSKAMGRDHQKSTVLEAEDVGRGNPIQPSPLSI